MPLVFLSTTFSFFSFFFPFLYFAYGSIARQRFAHVCNKVKWIQQRVRVDVSTISSYLPLKYSSQSPSSQNILYNSLLGCLLHWLISISLSRRFPRVHMLNLTRKMRKIKCEMNHRDLSFNRKGKISDKVDVLSHFHSLLLRMKFR